MLTVELNTRDIPSVYERFEYEIGVRSWKERVSLLKKEIKGNPFLKEYHEEESAIAFQLDQMRELRERFGSVVVPTYRDSRHYPAASFAAQVLSVIDGSSEAFAKQFRARVHAGIRTNPADLRALQLELLVATHFLRAGNKVAWPEMSTSVVEGQRLCDLLVEDLGTNGLELECKSFSEDKGRRISRREARDFLWLVRSNHWKRLRTIKDGVIAVITVKRKLPTAYKARLALAATVASQLLAGSKETREYDGTTIQTRLFDAPRLKTELFSRENDFFHHRSVLDELTGTVNKETVAMSSEAKGAFVLVLQSSEDDTVMDAIMRTMKESASSQFTATRPAMMVAGLNGINAEQLLSVAAQDNDPDSEPTSLRIHTSRFLASSGRDHIVGAIFLSSSALRPTTQGITDSGGTAYAFPKRTSPFWSDDFSDLFGERT